MTSLAEATGPSPRCARGELFVFAGGEARAIDLERGTRRTLEVGDRPLGRVLAATYDVLRDRLFVLDEVARHHGRARVRLLELDPSGATAEVLARWPRGAATTRFALTAARDGQLYLVASGERGQHALVALSLDDWHGVRLTGLSLGDGILASDRAYASDSGISCVVSRSSGLEVVSASPVRARWRERLVLLMLRAPKWMFVLAVVLCSLWSCSGPPAADVGGQDASSDAPDVEHADGPDVPDAARPEWLQLEGLAPACALERATDPDTVVTAHWEACSPELPAACEQLRFDRTPGTVEALLATGAGNASARGVTVASYVGEPPAIEHSYRTLLDAAGVALGSWRYVPTAESPCLPRPGAIRDAAALMVLSGFPERDVALMRTTTAAVGGAFAPSWRSTASSFPSAQQEQYPSLSETTYAVGLAPRGFILVIEGDRWAHVAGPTLPRPGAASPSAVVGHDVFFDWSSADLTTQEIQVATIDTPARTLYTAPADRVIAFVVSDGTWIAWRAAIRPAMVGDVIDFTELWVAPYTTEPSDFAPRLVRADLVSYQQQTIGDGYYAMADARTGVPHYVRVVSLDDGSARRMELPTGDPSVVWAVTGRPLWVTRDEVVVPVVRRVDGVPEQLVLRIPIASLTPEP